MLRRTLRLSDGAIQGVVGGGEGGVDGGDSDMAGGDFGCGMEVRIFVREVE